MEYGGRSIGHVYLPHVPIFLPTKWLPNVTSHSNVEIHITNKCTPCRDTFIYFNNLKVRFRRCVILYNVLGILVIGVVDTWSKEWGIKWKGKNVKSLQSSEDWRKRNYFRLECRLYENEGDYTGCKKSKMNRTETVNFLLAPTLNCSRQHCLTSKVSVLCTDSVYKQYCYRVITVKLCFPDNCDI